MSEITRAICFGVSSLGTNALAAEDFSGKDKVGRVWYLFLFLVWGACVDCPVHYLQYDMRPQVESLMYTIKVKITYICVLSAWCFSGTSFFGHPRKEALQLVALSWMVGV